MEFKVRIREMQKEDLPKALEALGNAFETNPNTVAIFGGKSTPGQRMQKGFEGMFRYLPGKVYVAEVDGQIVGAMRIVEWPACQKQSLRMLPSMLGAVGGIGPLKRAMKMQNIWKEHDPKKTHWHLNPLGVAPDFQCKGIGSKMMHFYCEIIDKMGIEAYHETDRPSNVPFYEKFGFKVVGEETINGIKNWFLLRPAKTV